MRILIIIALLLPQLIFAQSSGQYMQGNNLYMIKGNGDTILINAGSTTLPSATLTSVTDIANYNNATTTTLFIKDSIRGGTFFLYVGSDAADNGMIFTDANNNKWKRQVNDDKINVLWYGAKGDAVTDNIVPFEAAREYIRNHSQFKTLKIPFYNNAAAYNRYGFSRTFVINLPLRIEGQGIGPWQSSRLYFPPNTTGLLFQPFNYDFNCVLENINIENAFINRSLIDSNKALIVVHSSINMKNVKVLYATGNGIEISSDSGGDSTTNPTFGNAGFSSYNNVRIYEALNGFYIVGSESNAMQFNNCVLQANVRWGVLDDGFLGNTYYNCNFQGNSNNSLSGAATTVTYAGKYYAALPKHDDGTGVGKRPDLDTNYWLETGGRAAAPWDTTKHYWSGGSYYVKNANATTKFYQPYVEGDNAPFILNGRSESDGGIDGVGYGLGYRSVTSVGGHYMNGTVTIPQSSNPANRFGFGVGTLPDNTTMTHFKNKSGYNTISTFEGYNTFAFNNYKNTSGSYSVGYLNNQFRAYTSPTTYFFADSYKLGFGGGVTWDHGTGSPEGVLTAIVGSFYSRTNGGTGTALYIKETGIGNTGWVAATFGGGGISQQTLNDTAASIRSAIPIVTGTNTGDNATNTQYSGLAASKQDVLVSATNIKTINGTSVLGSGNIVVGGSSPTRVYLPNNVANAEAVANTLTDVVGLTFPVVAGSRYAFKVVIVYSSAATTTGSRWVINGPAATDMSYTSQYPTTATAITNNTSLAGYNLPSASNASSLSTNNRCIIQGELLPSANGSVQVRFASEITASAITAIASGRSYLEYQIIN